ncbi:hypothetical protein DL98DRAFT_641461 [Cadophora sp. DSE1049]|nr:hypothetical protein DL98DRAFT_641461 [Cadophora sp. DSE1049]
MSLTRSQVIRQVSICLLILWLTAIAIHVSLYPYLLSGPPSNPGDVILLWKIAPVIWWTTFIWLCDLTRTLYRDVVYVFLVGSCVGSALGVLGAVFFVHEEKWGPLVWGLGALWAVTFVLTTIAVYFVCNEPTPYAKLGDARVDGDQDRNFARLEEGRSSAGEEETEMANLNEDEQDRQSLVQRTQS